MFGHLLKSAKNEKDKKTKKAYYGAYSFLNSVIGLGVIGGIVYVIVISIPHFFTLIKIWLIAYYGSTVLTSILKLFN